MLLINLGCSLKYFVHECADSRLKRGVATAVSINEPVQWTLDEVLEFRRMKHQLVWVVIGCIEHGQGFGSRCTEKAIPRLRMSAGNSFLSQQCELASNLQALLWALLLNELAPQMTDHASKRVMRLGVFPSGWVFACDETNKL